MIQVTPTVFYKSGVVCFSIVAIGNLIMYVNYWNVNNILTKITSGASLAFNFILAGFFYYILSQLKATSVNSGENQEELNEAIEEFKKNGRA